MVSWLDMLNVVLWIKEKEHFLIFWHLEILLIYWCEIVCIHYLYNQDYRQDYNEDSDDEPETETYVGDVTDLSESLVILVFEEDISGGKQHDFVLFFIELQKELHIDFISSIEVHF